MNASVRVAGYDLTQIANAAVIADVARSLGMGERGALLGVMCAMGESSLRNIDYGDWETSGVRNPDGTPTTSIGLFQQQASWGSVADRVDPVYASWKFFDALGKVRGWRDLAPTIAIHRVQINADPNHYAKYETPARAVLAAIPDLREKGTIMADPMEVIEIPWAPGMYAVRALVDALDRAGRPKINSAHRVYQDQKDAWNAYRAGRGNPADNPDDPDNYELGHVRAIAVDIDVTPENVRRLAAVGLIRPFSWEGWHWRLPGSVRKWPLLFKLPTIKHAPEPDALEEDDSDMPINFRNAATGITYTMVPGVSIAAHVNGFGSRLSNYVNTGVWPASENDKDRYDAGLRDLSEDHVTWMLPLYGFGRLTAADLPRNGIIYSDVHQELLRLGESA